MRINHFEVSGLFGRNEPVVADLSEDLNIVTGRNGSGKTTILKLLWYIISGNILLALKEVNFSKATVITDSYSCTVHRLGPMTCRVEIQDDKGRRLYEDEQDEEGDVTTNAEDGANEFLMRRGSSVFFPTFRRIEGGFSMSSPNVGSSTPTFFGNALTGRSTRVKNEIEEALLNLSRKLTNNGHTFVTSISTSDISSILLGRYSDISEVSNNLQRDTSQSIIDQIKSYKSHNTSNVAPADVALDSIKKMIEDMEVQREALLSPLNAIQELAQELFHHAGIKISGKFSFGDAANAINSDALSAGEKQMLSFICYNALNNDCVIFIDEPELSLHVDWQRQLFPTLQGQGASNQFIIATHSPFIYSKYPDKEIPISADRGDVGS